MPVPTPTIRYNIDDLQSCIMDDMDRVAHVLAHGQLGPRVTQHMQSVRENVSTAATFLVAWKFYKATHAETSTPIRALTDDSNGGVSTLASQIIEKTLCPVFKITD